MPDRSGGASAGCGTDRRDLPLGATIKGTTGFLGFKRLEKLAHAGENLLGLLREGKLTADRPIITGLLQLLDGLRSILKTIEAEDAEGEGEDRR